METMGSNEDLDLYHIPDRSWYDSTEIIDLRKRLDMISMIDEHSPPLFLRNLNPNTIPLTRGEVVHHPDHAVFLKNIFDQYELDNAIVLAGTPVNERVDMLDFFFPYLLGNTIIEDNEVKFGEWRVYPNPADDILILRGGTEGKGVIYNVLGKVCWTGHVIEGMEIDIHGLNNGIYFLRIENNIFKFLVR